MSSKVDQARHDAAVLPRIRDLEANGLSLRQIADQLQADGFPTPGRTGRWSYVAVKRILDRAPKPPAQQGGGDTEISMPPPVTITVHGPVTTNAPMAQTGGEVTIEISGKVNTKGYPPPTSPSETEADEVPSKDSLIHRLDPKSLLALPPGLGYFLPSPEAAALILPAPFFLRRR